MRKLGYALIDDELKIVDSGILLQHQKSPTRQNQFERMSQIYDFFLTMLDHYPIEKIAMEKLFFTKFNQNNAEFVFGIRGILLMLAVKR